MAMPAALKAFTVLFVLAVLAADQVEGRHQRPDCPSFSCGPLRNVSSPFRQAGDPPGCGYGSYELVCSDTKATIHIDNATYYVPSINYSGSYFWVVNAELDLYNGCPLPRWNWHPYIFQEGQEVELAPFVSSKACFLKCSREVKHNGMYMPVACLSTNDTSVYVLTGYGSNYMEYLEPSCAYMAMTPLPWESRQLDNSSYADVVKSMRSGFAVQFPFRFSRGNIIDCLMNFFRSLELRVSSEGIMGSVLRIFWAHEFFLICALQVTGFGYASLYIALVITTVTLIAVLCRFVLAPLTMLIFLAYKYWKTRITIDAVEKFLRMQQMLGPIRYVYTDIIAITSHFRDKLGQGGYGSVYKGVLLPGDLHVAIKMLEGNSNCNGEDFINEVSTIGMIHHVNVVRLLGFCSEEMRRALVYEYMPGGSLDKYIFSSDKEKSFSWDKLNEIALGIARGINYLHQGCEMQILHFDIKPHNILLDSNFVPKVADFGLAKLYPRDNSFVPSNALRGTIGYIAPEMISRSFGVISSKSDVYSFGMLLLEMAGGRRNADPNAANSSRSYYPSWVYDQLSEQEVVELSPVDDMHELEKKLCIVGLWCIQMKSHDRPTMSEVIEMLERDADILQMPCRPFFCDEGHTHVEDSYDLSSELTTICEDDE
ncbi:LEAF RUST 10 DISEASE-RESISTANCEUS RECEPTOR-LIKE PROTEIN KINASE-like 2.5 [Lolium perenne]|uniref:LEAF RUST 10 DISEASE-RESISTANCEUS RECEPTOR-LIKE PROTEIN KINASE-like 2.5 n=1 Tax=Lolium perenne TaxID=4522 RepID=UPI0021EA818D|nr:rust resistance kinase Lr10-like [Lolium perenne]